MTQQKPIEEDAAKPKTARARKAKPKRGRPKGPKAKRPKKLHYKKGRLLRYSDQYPAVARDLFMRGESTTRVGERFGVCRVTIHRWAKAYPEFGEAMREGIAAAPGYRIAQIEGPPSAHAPAAKPGSFEELVRKFVAPPLRFAPVFDPLLPPARYKGVWGGRGSGKSHFFADLLIRDCLAQERMMAVCIREIQKDLKLSAKELIERRLANQGLGEAQGFRIYKEVIRTPGDGLITFQGMQDYNAESIKSLEGFDRAWVEEAQCLSARSLELLRPTIRAPGSELWFGWNPRLKTDAVDKLLRAPELPPGAVVVHARWTDNPWFTDVLEKEREFDLAKNPDQYGHIWDGDYVTVSAGAYYASPLVEARAQGRIGKVAFDPLMKVRLFFDIGGAGARADACAIWPAQFIGREIRVRDYYEAQGQPLAAHVAWLRSAGYGPERASIWLPHDGATFDRVHAVSYESALRDAGYEVTVVPNQGRGAAAARIEQARRLFPSIWFDEATTEAGRGALGWYHEKKDKARDSRLGPNHDWSSHGADAFGLMCVAYDVPSEPIVRRRPRREPYFGEGGWMG
jgi:phage terminase large subunit